MKYLLCAICLFVVTSCSKDFCRQKIAFPVDYTIDPNADFSYLDVRVGSDLITPYTHQVYYDRQGYRFEEYIDVTTHVQNVPSGAKVYVEYWLFCQDGSYKIDRVTVIKP